MNKHKRDLRIGQVHKQLQEQGIVTYTREAFTKYVNKGRIPYSKKGNVRYFNFDEVVEALKTATVQLNVKTSGKGDKAKSTPKGIKEISNLPPPKEGESEDEYQNRIGSSIGDAPTYEEAKIYQTIYMGKLAEQKFAEKEKLLISRDVVEAEAFKIARKIRDSILAMPERIAGELTTLTEVHEIKEVMYRELLVFLEDLSNPSALYGDALEK